MKTKFLLMVLGAVMVLALSGCNFTFNDFQQVDYVGTGQVFELRMNVSDNNAGGAPDNKTAMVGLRLPDGCSFVSGNMTDDDWWDGAHPNEHQILTENSVVTDLLDNSTCPARTGYQWFGYLGDDSFTVGDWQMGQVILNCTSSGVYELDVAVGASEWNITDYFCNNSFEVFTGSGTPASPYGLTTCDILEAMDSDPSGHYQLSNDVDCAGSSFDGVSNAFYGSFDGQGYTISNLDLTGKDGMFDTSFSGTTGANISNVKMDNITVITGNDLVGALIGSARYSRVWNIEVANSNIQGSGITGGAIGDYGSFMDGYNITVHDSVIDGGGIDDFTGGIAGRIRTAVPNASFYSYNNMIYGDNVVGGIAGLLRDTSSSQMKAVNITIDSSGGSVGGAFGESDAIFFEEIYVENINIVDCHDQCGGVIGRGDVVDYDNVVAHNITINSTSFSGGVVGQQSGGDVSNVLLSKYTNLNPDLSEVGVYTGLMVAGTIADVFYNGENMNVIDICGNQSVQFTYCTQTYVTNETEANLKLEATYTGWDFTTVFGIVDGTTYPYFLFNPQCLPDWSCTGYGSCNASDVAPCDTVVDGNSCGLSYTGDYSEFSTQACDFCAYDLTLINATACDSVTDTLTRWYTDDNFGTCCNISGLGADCAFGNASSGAMNESCSVHAYAEEDIPSSVIDTIVRFILAFGALVVLLVIFIIGMWARKGGKK